MATEMRKTGVDVVGDMPWGTHFCLFYETRPFAVISTSNSSIVGSWSGLFVGRLPSPTCPRYLEGVVPLYVFASQFYQFAFLA
jgi:hypothetical protein